MFADCLALFPTSRTYLFPPNKFLLFFLGAFLHIIPLPPPPAAAAADQFVQRENHQCNHGRQEGCDV